MQRDACDVCWCVLYHQLQLASAGEGVNPCNIGIGSQSGYSVVLCGAVPNKALQGLRCST